VDEGTLRLAIGAWVVALGAAVGSFLNVVIARVPAGLSIVRPGSRCPGCLTPIAWYDNVPVLSWIVLRARCRRCARRIPFRYPFVELLGAAAAYLAVVRHGATASAVAELAFVAMLIALAFIDLDTWLLPHAITWPLIGLGALAGAAGLAPARGLVSSAIGAAAGFAAFAAVSVVGARVFRREALGWGDVWLLAGIGAWLGVRALLPVVLLASLQGSVFGIALVQLGRGQPGPSPAPPAQGAPGTDAPAAPPVDAPHASADAEAQAEADWVPPRNAVPFGPFLALGALEWLYLAPVLGALVPLLGVFR
jgi:leader peptidase (prepilin peptidase)/N-methyltransferase